MVILLNCFGPLKNMGVGGFETAFSSKLSLNFIRMWSKSKYNGLSLSKQNLICPKTICFVDLPDLPVNKKLYLPSPSADSSTADVPS